MCMRRCYVARLHEGDSSHSSLLLLATDISVHTSVLYSSAAGAVQRCQEANNYQPAQQDTIALLLARAWRIYIIE